MKLALRSVFLLHLLSLVGEAEEFLGGCDTATNAGGLFWGQIAIVAGSEVLEALHQVGLQLPPDGGFDFVLVQLHRTAYPLWNAASSAARCFTIWAATSIRWYSGDWLSTPFACSSLARRSAACGLFGSIVAACLDKAIKADTSGLASKEARAWSNSDWTSLICPSTLDGTCGGCTSGPFFIISCWTASGVPG